MHSPPAQVCKCHVACVKCHVALYCYADVTLAQAFAKLHALYSPHCTRRRALRQRVARTPPDRAKGFARDHAAILSVLG